MYKAKDMVMRSLQNPAHVKRAVVALAICALLPGVALAEPAVEAAAVFKPSSDQMRDALLFEHNQPRKAQGRAALIWDDALARDAQKWADHLATKRLFEHAVPVQGDAAQGENLWMGTRGAYSAEEMVGLWHDEGLEARSGVFPNVSKTGDWRDIGHFTQMLWPSTRSIGCALASNAQDDVLVCRYFPAGNRIGDRFDVASGK
jgi:hypothetical protein